MCVQIVGNEGAVHVKPSKKCPHNRLHILAYPDCMDMDTTNSGVEYLDVPAVQFLLVFKWRWWRMDPGVRTKELWDSYNNYKDNHNTH